MEAAAKTTHKSPCAARRLRGKLCGKNVGFAWKSLDAGPLRLYAARLDPKEFSNFFGRRSPRLQTLRLTSAANRGNHTFDGPIINDALS